MAKSAALAADITGLLRARTELIWIVTKEESRVEPYLFAAAQAARYVPRVWDCDVGVRNFNGVVEPFGSTDLSETLTEISERAAGKRGTERGVWILRDVAPHIIVPLLINVCRKLQNLARSLPLVPPDYSQALIVISPDSTVPEKLEGYATVINWPLPDREEITETLDAVLKVNDPDGTAFKNTDAREVAIRAAIGLSGTQARDCFQRSLVQFRHIDPQLVASEKRRLVSKERLMEWYDPLPGGLDAVGGLDRFKAWIKSRAIAYTPAAKKYPLPPPKGILLVGIPGCGKSLCAKAVATGWERPLLKFNFGAQKSKYVGESESNIRKSLYTAEVVGGVVWIDEIEKDLSGGVDGAIDGGVSTDALGTFLNWMQERSGDCFVIATANDVTKLPPELLRRFTMIWSVDLPNRVERLEILAAGLQLYGRDIVTIQPQLSKDFAIAGDAWLDREENALADVIDVTAGFTGSEIAEKMIPEALYSAFADDQREITTDDLITAARHVIPLSKTAAEKVAKFRDWAAERATPATTPESTPATNYSNAIRLDLN